MRSKTLIACALPALLVIAWEVTTRTGVISPRLVAPPSVVAVRMVELLRNGELPTHAAISLSRLLAGFLIGSLLGFLVGTGIGLSRKVEAILAPTLRFFAPVPPIAWIPLLVILFGIGELSKVSLIAIGVFFITQFSTIQGIRGADSNLVEVGLVLGKTPWTLARSILIPAAMPNIFAGLRIAISLSWILLVAAEVIASSKGLGWLIWDSRNFSRPGEMLVGVIAVGALGKATDSVLARIEGRVLRWRTTYTGSPSGS